LEIRSGVTWYLTALKDEYASIGISGTFALFKELLKTKITQSSHPASLLSKIVMRFSHLEQAGYIFPKNIQAMLLLAKLPPSMDVVVQMIVQAKDAPGKAKDPTMEEIQSAAVLSWDQCHMQKEQFQAAQANKISAVKHKGDDLKFEQQQAPQGDSLK